MTGDGRTGAQMDGKSTLTLITPQGVYQVTGMAGAPETVATELTGLQYAARHLSHSQWSEVLRADRALNGGTQVLALPDDADTRRQ